MTTVSPAISGDECSHFATSGGPDFDIALRETVTILHCLPESHTSRIPERRLRMHFAKQLMVSASFWDNDPLHLALRRKSFESIAACEQYRVPDCKQLRIHKDSHKREAKNGKMN